MRYHYSGGVYSHGIHGTVYQCSHPLYNRCTLYREGERGLAVIQQRFSPSTKRTWWEQIDQWLIDEIYMNPEFKDIFDSFAEEPKDGLYPTVSVRQIMWRLKMKPLEKEYWETVFDKCPIKV